MSERGLLARRVLLRVRLGAMAVDLTTSSGRLSGAGCFVTLNYTTACNTVRRTVYGNDVALHIGGLHLSGRANGSYIDTTFRSDGGTVTARGYFTQDTSTAQAANELTGDAVAGNISAAFRERFERTEQGFEPSANLVRPIARITTAGFRLMLLAVSFIFLDSPRTKSSFCLVSTAS